MPPGRPSSRLGGFGPKPTLASKGAGKSVSSGHVWLWGRICLSRCQNSSSVDVRFNAEVQDFRDHTAGSRVWSVNNYAACRSDNRESLGCTCPSTPIPSRSLPSHHRANLNLKLMKSNLQFPAVRSESLDKMSFIRPDADNQRHILQNEFERCIQVQRWHFGSMDFWRCRGTGWFS